MKKSSASKKSKKINFAKANKKPILVLVVALFIATGVAAVLQTRAASYTIIVCNSYDSTDTKPISPYQSYWPNNAMDYYRNNCSGYYYTDGARVKVRSQSYKVKPVGGSYSYCQDGPKSDSNPPNVSKVYYKTYPLDNCKTY